MFEKPEPEVPYEICSQISERTAFYTLCLAAQHTRLTECCVPRHTNPAGDWIEQPPLAGRGLAALTARTVDRVVCAEGTEPLERLIHGGKVCAAQYVCLTAWTYLVP